MIDATQADIGRRVTYDARPILKHMSHGKLVGIGERCLSVLFDDADAPLNVISNLRWADEPSSEAPSTSQDGQGPVRALSATDGE